MRKLPRLPKPFHAQLVLLLMLALGCGSTPTEPGLVVISDPPSQGGPPAVVGPPTFPENPISPGPPTAPSPNVAVLSGHVTDRITSAPIAGATVIYGARATTDSLGSYSLPVPPSDLGKSWAVVYARAEGYDEDARYFRAASQDFRLYPIEVIPPGGSRIVTVLADDSLCGTDNLAPTWGVDHICRVVHIAPADGILTVHAVATDGGSPPMLDVLVYGGGRGGFGRETVSVEATGSSRILIYVAIPAGSPTQSFTLTTTLAR